MIAKGGGEMSEICFFPTQDSDLYVTEFGFSAPQKPRAVGPWVRGTYILHYVLDGTCHFDGFDARAGEAFLIVKDSLHHFTVSPPYRHFWLAFDGSDVGTLLAAFSIPLRQHMRFSVQYPEAAGKMLETAFRACMADVGTDALARGALLSLFPLLSAPTAVTASAVQTAAWFIERHYTRPITMEQVAAAVHWSEKYLCKQFKKQFGIPPQRYLVQIRMQRALALLRQKELRVQEVALSVGHPSAPAFSAAFKSYTGVSPSDYRNT